MRSINSFGSCRGQSIDHSIRPVFLSKVKRMIQPPTFVKSYKLYHTGTIFVYHLFFRVDLIAMKYTTNVQNCGATIEVRNIGVRLRRKLSY